jgi:F0F1-type ATP synthase membrane subunit b/b'
MDANDNNRYLPDETDQALDEIFVDVLRRAHEVVHVFISDEQIERRLRQVVAAAAESNEVPEWVPDAPIDIPVMQNEYLLDQQVAQWTREEARAELRVARAKVNEIVDAATSTANLITDEALDAAATTRAEAELDAARLQLSAERERLAAEREQLAAARARLEAEMHQARLEFERERQTAELDAERARLRSEANLQECQLKLDEAKSIRSLVLQEAFDEAASIKHRARMEANGVLSEAQRRVQRTYPVDPVAHQPDHAAGRPHGTGPGTDPGGRRFGMWLSRLRSFACRTNQVPPNGEPSADQVTLSEPSWVRSVAWRPMADRAVLVDRKAAQQGAIPDVNEVELSAEQPTELADLEFARVTGES